MNKMVTKVTLRFFQWGLPALIAALGLGASVVSYRLIAQEAQRSIEIAVEQQADRLTYDIRSRFERSVYGLNGANSVWALTMGLDQTSFENYVATRDMAGEFPGVRALGMVQPVPKSEEPALVARLQQQGLPNFVPRRLSDASQDSAYLIVAVAPPGPNLNALGLDVGSEPNRRAAMDRSIATGQPTISGPIKLLQDAAGDVGFLIFTPSGRLVPGEERKRTYREGDPVFFSAVNARELLGDLAFGDGVAFKLFEGEGPPDSLALVADVNVVRGLVPNQAASPPDADHLTKSRFISTRKLIILGRQFTLRTSSQPALEKRHSYIPAWLSSAFVLVVTLVLTRLVWRLLLGMSAAQARVKGLSTDLERMAQVAQLTSNAVVITDPQGHISWHNHAFGVLSGGRTQALKGQPLRWSLTPSARAGAAVAAWVEAFHAGRPFQGELVLSRGDSQPPSDGSTHVGAGELTIVVEARPYFDAEGRFAGQVMIGTDITERRALERRLSQNYTQLEQTGAMAKVGGWSFDLHTESLSFSAQTARLHGLMPDEQLSLAEALDFYLPEAREEITLLVQNAIQKGEPWDCELPIRNVQGEVVWLRSQGNVETVEGTVVRVFGAVQDVTEQRALRQLQQRENALLQESIDSLPFGIAVFDAQDRLLMRNGALAEVLQLPEGFLDQPDLHLVDLIRFRYARGDYGNTLSLDERVAVMHEPMRAGEPIVMEQSCADHNILLARGIPMTGGWTLMAYEDVTEARVADMELQAALISAEAASKAKGRFLANMSHEVRTPINGIMGMLQLLQNDRLDARQQRRVDEALASSRLLLRILNDILDFSKIEAGKLDILSQPFQMEDVLRDVAALTGSALGDKPIDLWFDTESRRDVWLMGDDLRLRQVLLNLTSNAVKFTESGHVTMRVYLSQLDDGRVRLEVAVEDSGIGMTCEQMERVFTGFEQAEADTTRRFGGSGLGLAISKHLLAMMGSTLDVESQIGVGSTFSFALDLWPAQVLPDGTSAAVCDGGPHAGLTVLLVTDKTLAAAVLQRMCVSQGWHIVVRSTAEGAAQGGLAHGLAITAFDLLLYECDLLTPAHCAALHTWRNGGASGQVLPCIALVRRRATEPLPWGANSQVVELLKPATPGLLLHAVRDVLDPVLPQAAEQALAPALGLAPVLGLNLPSAAGLAEPAEGTALARLRVLLVDDNRLNRDVAEAMLTDEGAQVVLAVDGQDALDTLDQPGQRFDLVLMDIQMPRLDGLQATRAIRQDARWTSLPVVAMTANAMQSDRQACTDAGMQAFIAKPFEFHELIRTVQQQVRAALGHAVQGQIEQGQEPVEALLARPAAGMALNISAAIARTGMRAERFAQALRLWEADTRAQLQAIAKVTGAGPLDADALKALAFACHAIKGASSLVGAEALASLAQQTENLAREASTLPLEPLPGGDATNSEAEAAAHINWEAQHTRLEHGFAQAVSVAQQWQVQFELQQQDMLPQTMLHKVMPTMAGPRTDFGASFSAEDAHPARPLLLGLRAALAGSDMEAQALLAQVQAQHPELLNEAVMPLAEAVLSLDYATALDMVDRLLVSLGP